MIYGKAAITIETDEAKLVLRTPDMFIDIIDTHGYTSSMAVFTNKDDYTILPPPNEQTGADVFGSFDTYPFVVLRRDDDATPYLFLLKDKIDSYDRVTMDWITQHSRNNRLVFTSNFTMSDEEKEQFRQNNATIVDNLQTDDLRQVGSFTRNDAAELLLSQLEKDMRDSTGIYQFDELVSGNDPSGVSLMYRLETMGRVLSSFESMARESLQLLTTRYLNYLTSMGIISNPDNIFPIMKTDRNIPRNKAAEVNLLTQAGASRQTILERVGLNADEEIERIKEYTEQVVGDSTMDIIDG